MAGHLVAGEVACKGPGKALGPYYLPPGLWTLVEAWPRVLQPLAAGRWGCGRRGHTGWMDAQRATGAAVYTNHVFCSDASLHPAADFFYVVPVLGRVYCCPVLLFVLYGTPRLYGFKL